MKICSILIVNGFTFTVSRSQILHHQSSHLSNVLYVILIGMDLDVLFTRNSFLYSFFSYSYHKCQKKFQSANLKMFVLIYETVKAQIRLSSMKQQQFDQWHIKSGNQSLC